VTLRSFKLATRRPIVFSGVAFLYGYGRAAAVGTPRVASDEFRTFVRRELRQRIAAAFRPSAMRRARAPGTAKRDRDRRSVLSRGRAH
jgi:hypothetical protein